MTRPHDTLTTIVPRIETERLVLRAIREDDFEPWAEMAADADFNRYLRGEPLDRGDAWRAFAMILGHWTLRGYGFFAVEEKASGRFVGRVGPWFPEGWPEPEIGWAIGPQHQRRGFATEAARASLEWAFEDLGWTRAIHVIKHGNAPSIGVAEKLGSKKADDAEIFGMPCHVYAIERADYTSGQS